MRNKKYLLACCVFFSSILLHACHEGENKPNDETPECPYVTPQCSEDGTKLLSCFNGVEQSLDCAGGCVNGICNMTSSTPEGCQYSSPQCSADGQSLLKCVNGVESQTPCAYGCENGACKAETPKCTDLLPHCSEDGSSVVSCVDGTEQITPCTYGCQQGACKVLGSCNYVESECTQDGRYLISCVNGNEVTEACEHGCDAWGHKCYEPVEDDELGTACRLEADPYCKGDALIYCGETYQGNVWVKQDAPDNFICGNYEGMNMLLEKCEKAGEEATLCSSSMQLARVCTDVDGQLLYLPDYFSDDTTYCYAGCDGNACAEELPPATCDASNFTESCTSATGLHQCINGTVYDRDCEGNQVCIINSTHEAVCGEICSPEQAPAFECFDGYSDEGKAIQIAVPLTCVKNPVSEVYGLERADLDQWIDCPGACSTTRGCE